MKFIQIFLVCTLTNCTVKTNLVTSNDQTIVEEEVRIDTPINLVSSNIENKIISDSSKYCYSSCPDLDPQINQLIYHNDFVLSYNIDTKYADWVAYKIDKNKISGPTRKRIWKSDPQISKDLAIIPSDYKKAFITCNYDRGHQAPLADFSNSNYWEEVNYLSNITPQKADLNRGPWSKLETKIRLVNNNFKGNIYILTGTYYDGGYVCRLPYARINNTVPNGYWKIITLVNHNNVYRAFFKFEQETSKNDDFCKYKISPQQLKKLLPYSLNINSNTENSREALNMLGCKNS